MRTIAVNAITDANAGNTTTINGVTPNSANVVGKNILINGNFDVWQRGTSRYSTYGLANYYADRWSTGQFQDSAFERVTVTTGLGPKAQYAIKVSSSSTAEASSGTRMALGQMVESVNSVHLAGQQVTLSFWIRFSSASSSSFGNFSYQINEFDTADVAFDSNGATRANSTSISNGTLPTTWTKYTVTVTTASTMKNLAARFLFATPANTTNNSDFWYEVTGVQLEAGESATEFEHRPYTTEELLCFRYYYLDATDRWLCAITTNDAGYRRIDVNYPVTMRAAPTVTATFGSNQGSITSGTQFASAKGITFTVDSMGAGDYAYVNFNANAEL